MAHEVDAPPTTLRRDAIGLSDALASTLSNMAPVEGIFIVVTIVAAAMGSFTPWAFMIGAVAIAGTGWAMSQFARRVPGAGSYVGFAYHGFGAIHPTAGRVMAAFVFYLSLIGGPVTLAAVVVFLGSWLQTALGLATIWWLVIALLVVALTLPIVLRGIVASARTAFVFFTLEVGGLLLVSLVVLFQSGDSVTAPLHASGGGFAGLAGITFATAVSGFVGWENPAGLAEEIRRPRRVVPIAILGSIAVVALLYLVATWAAVAGYAHWQGVGRLGDLTNAAPFVELADHYAPWLSWAVVAIGVISPAACYLAGMTSTARWTYASARSGLLPRPLARISPTRQVPSTAVWLWAGLVALLCVVPYLLLNGNAVEIAAYEAGIGTTPLLLVYLLTSIAMPIYVFRRDRAEFRITVHVLPSVVGVGVIGYGIYEFVQPTQPPPADTFWVYLVAILAVAAVAAGVAQRRLSHEPFRVEETDADR